LVPLMTGESSDLHLPSYGESIEMHSMFGSSILRCLRQGNWKYIHKLRPELYNVAQDPGELRNLASQRPDKVKELADALREEIRNAPRKPSNAEVAIDDETIRQLRALGYASAGPSEEFGDELASLELKGPDPSDLAQDIQTFSEGWYFASLTDYESAALVFSNLAKRHPKSLQILTSLADSLIHLERYEEAIVILNRAIETNPSHEKSYSMLGQSAEALGQFEEAEVAARQALELQACASDSRLRLATILGRTDRQFEQVETLKAGIEACPDAYEVLNNYAYLLSTSPKAEIRNGVEAIRIASRAVKLSGGTRPAILDTLAGAHAEVGDFKKAVDVSQRAIELAREKKMPGYLIDALERNMARFKQRRPSREE
jgi:tetratricopeptide (TPR) repeat protein